MEICKDAVVKGIGAPDESELALINALARRELEADEVYTFALRLCDNDIDRDFERFDDGTLDELATMFVGLTMGQATKPILATTVTTLLYHNKIRE